MAQTTMQVVAGTLGFRWKMEQPPEGAGFAGNIGGVKDHLTDRRLPDNLPSVSSRG